MIEIIYDETEQGKPTAEIPIRLPKNIRQIGDGTNDTKIYIEDYVITFIHKFWSKDRDSVGILLGEVKHSGKESYIFVPGAIEVGGVTELGDNADFGEEVWSDIYSTIKQYFNGYMIVGWFVNRKTTCQETDVTLSKVHFNNFPGADKILFLADTVEKEEAVYRVESGVLKKQDMYYVYYERNTDMQEYMTADKADIKPLGAEEETKESIRDDYKELRKERKVHKVRKEETSGGPFVGLLYGACTFLAVVILMIGIAMMNNYDKIAGLEQLVSELYKTAMGEAEPATDSINYERETKTTGDVDNIIKSSDATTETGKSIEDSEVTGESQSTSAKEDEDAIVTTSEAEGDDVETESVITEPEGKETETQNGAEETDGKTGGEKIEAGEIESTADAEEETSTEDVMTVTDKYYIVKAGDTLTSISRKFYNTDTMVDALKALNHIENGDYIFEGQIINLP